MQTVKTVVVAIAFVGVLLLTFPGQSLAQQPQHMNLNDSQLRSFAKVYVQIEKIRQTYASRLGEAKNPEQSKQIQDEAMSKMEQALRQEGMDKQTYNQIIEIARADEGVRKKLTGFINKERQKS